MDNCFIISSSLEYANAIKRYFFWAFKLNSTLIQIEYLPTKTQKVFHLLSQPIEKSSAEILRNSFAIVDEPFYEEILTSKEFDPLKNIDDLRPLYSMLILGFPEIHFIFQIFLRRYTENNGHIKYWLENIDGFSNMEIKSSPIFDPYGNRNQIRKNIKENPDVRNSVQYLKERGKPSASIDEEVSYAYLHGYLAYKIDYRSFVVTTQKMMEELFKNKSGNPYFPKVDLTFEDLFLNFPDREKIYDNFGEEIHFSNLQKRDEHFERLQDTKKRIFVTVGHKHIHWYEDNKDYIKLLKYQDKKIKTVYKPSGGIYNVLGKSGLLKEYWKRRKEEWEAARPSKESAESPIGHSAPGRLLAIAERLINRAEKIFHDAKTVQDCIHGAALALEAQELLGYRTPTTCLEAIALRHQLEVKAECMFYGMDYNIDVKNRFKEIKEEVKAVSRWFNPKVKKRAVLDANMRMITEIMRIFRDSGQFDEEQTCLNYLRSLNRKWSLMQSGLKGLLCHIIYPIRWYIETLLGSFPLFILVLLSWPALFGILSWKFHGKFEFDHFFHSFYTFFGLQPVKFPIELTSHILTLLLVLGGFLHLGIFIAHLYTLISRR